MDDQNDSDDMNTRRPHPDSIAGLLKSIAYASKRRKLEYVGVWVKLYSDGSGEVNDQFDNRTGFGTIAECLDILSR